MAPLYEIPVQVRLDGLPRHAASIGSRTENALPLEGRRPGARVARPSHISEAKLQHLQTILLMNAAMSAGRRSWETLRMELIIGLIGVVSGVAIPIYLHLKSHPKREIRYAVTPVMNGSRAGLPEWRVALWSSGRADIPSALFDSARPIVMRFSNPVSVLESTASGGLIEPFRSNSPVDLALPAQLLRQEFRAEARFSVAGWFDLSVENPIIGVELVRDRKAEGLPPARQERAVQQSKKRSRITFLRIATWLTVASFAMFVVGVTLVAVKIDAGTGIGIPGMLLTPVGLVLLAIAGIRNLIARLRENN